MYRLMFRILQRIGNPLIEVSDKLRWYHGDITYRPSSYEDGLIFLEESDMSQIFEALMVICFGISWPISISKSYKARTAKGKSIIFMFFIVIGYAFGIISKLSSGNITYVFVFYVLNFVMVSIDIALYFRNSAIDKKLSK